MPSSSGFGDCKQSPPKIKALSRLVVITRPCLGHGAIPISENMYHLLST